jgi:hypothetical protein
MALALPGSDAEVTASSADNTTAARPAADDVCFDRAFDMMASPFKEGEATSEPDKGLSGIDDRSLAA